MARQMRMAVSRRMAAVVALGSALVGFTAARAAPPGSASAAISGNGVTDGSLLLRDFKRGQLERRFYTQPEVDKALAKLSRVIKGDIHGYFKLDAAGFVKLDGAGYLKLDALGIQKISNAGFLKLDLADSRYLKIDAAAKNAIKFDGKSSSDFVQGHGQVLTGQTEIPANGEGPDIIVVPGFISGRPTGKGFEIRNLSSGPLQVLFGDGSVTPQSIGPGLSAFLPAVQRASSAQVLDADTGAGPHTVVTLSVSSFGTVGGGTQHWTAQAVVGEG